MEEALNGIEIGLDYLMNELDTTETIEESDTLNTTAQDSNATLVRYGRGTIKKNTQQYRDMRKRNNLAINIHRKTKRILIINQENENLINEIEKCIVAYQQIIKTYSNEINRNENCQAMVQKIDNLIEEFKDIKN